MIRNPSSAAIQKMLVKTESEIRAESHRQLRIKAEQYAERVKDQIKAATADREDREDFREYADSIEVREVEDQIVVGPTLEKTSTGKSVSQLSRLLELGNSENAPNPIWRREAANATR